MWTKYEKRYIVFKHYIANIVLQEHLAKAGGSGMRKLNIVEFKKGFCELFNFCGYAELDTVLEAICVSIINCTAYPMIEHTFSVAQKCRTEIWIGIQML